MIQKIVIIGATSTIATHCARIWLSESPKEVVLLGRDRGRIDRVVNDLVVRSPNSKISADVIDFLDPSAIREWTDQICQGGAPDIVLVAHGSLPDQSRCQQDLTLIQDAIQVNAISPILFSEAFVGHMDKANKGTLAIIGSVAGDRGRKSNYVYGSAKGLLTRYTQGLQHRFARNNVKIILIKPGPTDTPMTAGLKGKGSSLASVELVAGNIVDGIKKSSTVIYAPKKWAFIMMIIRHLPRFVFNKMDI